MKKNVIKKYVSICMLAILLGFSSCSKETEGVMAETDDTYVEEIEDEIEEIEDLTNKSKNLLTGYYIDKDIAKKRPVAVVINNLRKALPQSGISQADLFYEVLAEGDITRIIAIFQDFDSIKIGPVRSTRHYFLDFALDNDAMFVHHGGSPAGYDSIKSLKINNLDGMALEGSAFWRDPERRKQSGMYEHSSYTNKANLLEAIEKYKYRDEKYEDYVGMFQFYDEVTSPANSKESSRISIPFSKAYTSTFEYDSEMGLYSKFQGEDKHIDEETGEQLKVSNIIVQLTDMYIISGDDAGRREVKLVSSGEGYLITNGVYTEIKWEKKSHEEPTKWYFKDGQPLKLNKGKTWICVYNGEVDFNIEEELEDLEEE